MIRAEGVGVRAGAAMLLQAVDACVVSGRVLAVLGPNGAGKSTLLDVLAGGRVPQAGTVTVAGRPARAWSALELARMRAVLPQASKLAFDFSAASVVALGRQPFAGTPAMQQDAVAIQQARQALGLDAVWHRAVPGLSGGEQQRVHMARAAAQLWRPAGFAGPRFLLLDEPTSALDLRHRRGVLDLARQMARDGVGVMAVLHDLNLAADYADDVLLLRGGRVLRAGPAAAVLTEAALEECFEVRVETLIRADGGVAFMT